MLTKKNVLLLFAGLFYLNMGFSQEQELPELKDSSNKAFLYYAFLDFEKTSADTIFIEEDVYFFIKPNGKLFLKVKSGSPLPVPKEYYNDLSAFVFTKTLADDAYGILKRMSELNGLLENAKLGIDVAHHQGVIDWGKVKIDTLPVAVKTVYIRSTLGYNVNYDSHFVANYANVKAKEFPIGFYHNFVLNKDHRPDFIKHAQEQAYKFVESFKGRSTELKPVLDIEVHETYGVKAKCTPDEVRKAARTFIDIVEKELHTDVIIYTFESFYQKYLDGFFDNRYVWLARYPQSRKFDTNHTVPGTTIPYLGIAYDFSKKVFNYTLKTRSIGWQFSETGKVKGIPANDVDLNLILNKDYDKWLWKK